MPEANALSRRLQHLIPVSPPKLALNVLANSHNSHHVIPQEIIIVNYAERDCNAVHCHAHLFRDLAVEAFVVDRSQSVVFH